MKLIPGMTVLISEDANLKYAKESWSFNVYNTEDYNRRNLAGALSVAWPYSYDGFYSAEDTTRVMTPNMSLYKQDTMLDWIQYVWFSPIRVPSNNDLDSFELSGNVTLILYDVENCGRDEKNDETKKALTLEELIEQGKAIKFVGPIDVPDLKVYSKFHNSKFLQYFKVALFHFSYQSLLEGILEYND